MSNSPKGSRAVAETKSQHLEASLLDASQRAFEARRESVTPRSEHKQPLNKFRVQPSLASRSVDKIKEGKLYCASQQTKDLLLGQ